MAAACLEIAASRARNRHRHAIEQASTRRWRGGRRDDSKHVPRRKILISTQAATPVEHVALVEELVLVLGAPSERGCPSHALHAPVAPFDRESASPSARAPGVDKFAKGLWVPKKISEAVELGPRVIIENFSPGPSAARRTGVEGAVEARALVVRLVRSPSLRPSVRISS